MSTQLEGAVRGNRSVAGSTRHEGVRLANERWTEQTGARLLVVDPLVDEGENGIDLREPLGLRGVHVTEVASALDGLVALGRTNPEAVVVASDIEGLPAVDFIRKVREHSGALVIAASDDVDSESVGAMLLAGAMSTIARPYSADTVWKVWQRSAQPPEDHVRITYGPIELDARAYTVHIHGERIADLPLKEFEMLRTLMFHAPRVISNDEFRMALWGNSESGPRDNTIAVHIGRLRNRLQHVARIRRVRGRGYSLTIG
jgi:two-component system OmpR family response regulator